MNKKIIKAMIWTTTPIVHYISLIQFQYIEYIEYVKYILDLENSLYVSCLPSSAACALNLFSDK